ncbi:MAG: hypothetical protein LBC83_04845 [Oscillospiraceae bacterium]|jgi:hypothetical protein|nr:hypothetical protein [Oscillospiraceae bacterium]
MQFRKLSRHAIPVLLCVALLASLAAAGGVSAQERGNAYSPVIVVPGIGQSPLDYYNPDGSIALDDDGNELGGYHKMIMLDTRGILENALRLVLAPAIFTLLFQQDFGLSKAANKLIATLLSPHATHPDGTLVNDLRPRRFDCSIAEMDAFDRGKFYDMIPMRKLTAKIGEDRTFFFAYNLMGDAVETAKELDAYIQRVKAKCHSDKVTLANLSLGGSVYVAYLDMFGDKGDLDHVVNIVAVLDGSDAVGDLFERSFALNDRYFYDGLIPDLIETIGGPLSAEYDLNPLLGVALRILPRKALERTLSAAYDFLHTNLMLQNPQLWAAVPLNRYAELRNRYLKGEKYAVLRQKLDAYFAMQERFDQNTLDAVAAGVRIDNLAGYGLTFGEMDYPIFGAGASAKTTNSDGVIHVESTGQGVTAAPAGKALPADHAQKSPGAAHPSYSYISPDGELDASTCVLPNNTWFFYRQHHEAGRYDIFINLAIALITDPELTDVHAKPAQYTQFNLAVRTQWMRRDWIPRAEQLLADDSTDLAPGIRAELQAALAEARTALDATIADPSAFAATSLRLTNALKAAGAADIDDHQPKNESWQQVLINGFTDTLGWLTFILVGARGFSDWWRLPRFPGLCNGFGVLH